MANEYWQVFTTDQDDSHIPCQAPATGWFELQEHAGLGFNAAWEGYPLEKMTRAEHYNTAPRATRAAWVSMEAYGRMRLCSGYSQFTDQFASYCDVWDWRGEYMFTSYNGYIQGVYLDDVERRDEIATLSPYGGWPK